MAQRIKLTRKIKFLNQEAVFQLFEEFINDSYSGRRTKKNGSRMSPDSVKQYEFLLKSLYEFFEQNSFEYKIFIVDNLTQTEKEKASMYNKKFYTRYTNFLYNQKKFFDNYVGMLIKTLRAFYNYLEKERNISVGHFHQAFFVPKEEIPIITLSKKQLNYFIHDPEFHKATCENDLEGIKDIFVFGCTVALRVSDLLNLTRKNLIVKDNTYYLQVKSKKTFTITSIKLPQHAVDILIKYEKGKHATLLPPISNGRFNIQLKKLGALIPDNYDLVKTRDRKGKPIVVYKDSERRIHYKFSDHITSHTMRRTAITTMLNLGMPEHIVRQISGHAANSKEFYRYVKLSQSLIDEETDRVFELIKSF